MVFLSLVVFFRLRPHDHRIKQNASHSNDYTFVQRYAEIQRESALRFATTEIRMLVMAAARTALPWRLDSHAVAATRRIKIRVLV